MAQARTQIYLEPEQHAALLKEARALGVSLAGIIRGLIDEHLGRRARAAGAQERRQASLALISLGASGTSDVSENVDRYLAADLHREIVRDRPVKTRPTRRPRKTR